MKAVIMAGGEGTRLRPMTCNTPKPLVKLCGRPVSQYILELLAKHGCEKAVFTLRYLGEQIESHFEKGEYDGIKLDFSYENQPLGTAGCVKNAVENTDLADDDFIVISGDAMCDFDLSKALAFHKNSKAAATIITKRVDDPREYGLVISEKGVVKGFSEKPSFTACVTDTANTGVYILSPQTLELIPKDKMWDFAKDVFPQMLKKKMKLMAYEEQGYWCDIGDFTSYKSCQQDMLSGKVDCAIENNSSDFYKNVKINQPCYIGKNVKIGAGTVIEEGSVICDNVTVGGGCKIHASVILDGAFISDKATCNMSVVCENARLETGCSMFENSVAGAGCIIGEGGVICGDVKIWPEKNTAPHTAVRENVKYGAHISRGLNENGVDGETNADITPSFIAKLGSACASAFSGKTIIACGSKMAAVALKACFCAGFSSAGSKIIDCGTASLPMLIYLSRILGAEGIVHIEAAEKTHITMLNKGGLPLTRVQERKLENGLAKGEYANARWEDFGEIRTFKNPALLYSGMLEGLADFTCRYNVRLNCNNPVIKSIFQPVCNKISNPQGEPLMINLNYSGTRAQLYVSANEKADYSKLITIAAADAMKKGFDVAVPMEFPSALERVGKELGREVKRFFRCSNDNSDREARKIALSQPFLFDGAVLALEVLAIVTAEFVTLGEYLRRLPEFICENRFIPIDVPPQKILNRLPNKNGGNGEGVLLKGADSRVLLRSSRRGDGLFLFAEGCSAETARELCDEAEKKVRELLSEEKRHKQEL